MCSLHVPWRFLAQRIGEIGERAQKSADGDGHRHGEEFDRFDDRAADYVESGKPVGKGGEAVGKGGYDWIKDVYRSQSQEIPDRGDRCTDSAGLHGEEYSASAEIVTHM